MKRVAARGIIFKDDKLIVIHRIRENEGKCEEYYVFPGGGVEYGETLEEAVVREIKEEIGIEINVIRMLYKLESENDTEYFFVCKYLQGRIGTGIGPEFNSEDYRNRGAYIPELINIDDVGESLFPKKISNLLRNDLKSFAKLEFAPQKTLR